MTSPATGAAAPLPRGTAAPLAASEKEAKAALARLRERIPEARSAYEASGIVPPLAFLLMVPGAAAGAVAGLAAGALALALAAAVTGILYGMFLFTISGHVIFLVAAFFVGLVLAGAGLLTIAGPPAAAGAVAGWTVWRFASAGRSRGHGAAAAFASVSGLGTYAVLFLLGRWAALRWAAPGSPAARLFLGGEAGTIAWWGWIVLAVGALLVVAGAWAGVTLAFEAERFCEPCSRRMGKLVRKLGLEALLALPVGAPHAVAAAAPERGAAELSGEATLFRCEGCGNGFLDLSLTATARHPGKPGEKPEAVEESWRCASRRVGALEARALEAALDRGA